jgi:hypothetical protein
MSAIKNHIEELQDIIEIFDMYRSSHLAASEDLPDDWSRGYSTGGAFAFKLASILISNIIEVPESIKRKVE